jgi:hypothetical protein
VCSLAQSIEENEILTHYSCIKLKGLITRIYRELKKLNSQKINDPIKNWATELNRNFSEEEVQKVKKHRKNAHNPWP